MRRLSIGIAALIMLALAGPSRAATVVALEWGDRYGTYRDVVVDAKPGEANDIHVEGDSSGTRISDSVPVTAEFGCVAQPDASVFCPEASTSSTAATTTTSCAVAAAATCFAETAAATGCYQEPAACTAGAAPGTT